MELENFKKIINADWKEIAVEKWKNISPVSKKSFWYIFGIINLVFLWHTITFFFGNHDWAQIKYGLDFGWSMFDGRWGAGVIQQITGGDILPVWNNLFCFAGFTFAVILLAKYWDLPKNTFIYTIFGLFIILLPYTMPWLQFVRSETHFWNVFLIVFALTICSYKKLWAYILAFVLFLFCLGCYAAMLPTILIILIGRLILDVWFDNKTFKQLVKEYWQTVLVILCSFSVFVIIWLFIKTLPTTVDYMSVESVDLKTFLKNILYIGNGLKDTFCHTIPFIPAAFKILLGFAIPCVTYLTFKHTKKQIILLIFIFAFLFIFTQTTDLLSMLSFTNQLRIDFFTMPYTYALFWAILLKTGKCWENLAIVFMCMAIFYGGLQDVRAQKIKYFDKIRDTKICDDVINRIKINPKFNPDKKYKLIMIGEMSTTGEPSAFDIYNSEMSWMNAWAPLICNWNAEEYFNFYEKEPYISISYSKFSLTKPYIDYHKLNKKYIFNKAEIYPSVNSIYIDDNDLIYVVFSKEELQKLKDKINEIDENKKK